MAVDPVAAPIVLDWPAMTSIVDRLTAAVRDDRVPDAVIGVLRGGMVPAVMLAHRLGVRKVRAVEVVHTLADGVDAAKTSQPVAENVTSLGDLSGLDVLVVDDIVGSGDTMAVTAELALAAGAGRVRTAASVVNTGNWRREQRPEQALTYLGVDVEGWVIFPWES